MFKRKTILFFLIAVFLFAGCSIEVRYKMMSFVFDGVPNPNERKNYTLTDTLSVTDSISIVNQKIPEETVQNQLVFHSPYQERKCTECHDPNNMGSLKNKMPELCYGCHTNLSEKYKVLHGPVDAGYCNACHLPHSSENSNLLVKKEEELCIDCHLAKDIFANNLHDKQNGYSCYDCHNVHGGEDISLQKPGTCYYCHENLKERYKYLHGPVGGGYCKTCHGSHTLRTKYLLIKVGRELCLNCHQEERIMETETHKEISDTDCTDCHDAHGGQTMEFLY